MAKKVEQEEGFEGFYIDADGNKSNVKVDEAMLEGGDEKVVTERFRASLILDGKSPEEADLLAYGAK